MSQLDLPLGPVLITGQHCVPFMDSKGLERMRSNGLVKPGQPLYLLKNGDHHLMTWCGRGQKPRWVQDWLQRGGSLQDIEARV